MTNKKIDVVIPVYRPNASLRVLLQKLNEQSCIPNRILLVNTEKKYFDDTLTKGMAGIEVIHIEKKEFDHGGTRHMAAELLNGDFILFMTQDAMPADKYLIEMLVRVFEDEQVAAACARQLPNKDCNILERYTRSFNYGTQSRIKTAKDLPELGIKTFFCSNVCAMYRRSVYERLGGFERKTIFNEDMIFAGKLIREGMAVAYCAEARVIHSHNYSGIQQFHRNFDLGVSQAEHMDIFSMARSENEGIRMVKQTAGYLLKNGKFLWIPKLIWQSGCKYMGYRMGKAYQKLPKQVILKCTMNREYWSD